MELQINARITLDDLNDCFRDVYEQAEDDVEFNKFAFEVINILLYRSDQLGGLNKLKDKISKYKS